MQQDTGLVRQVRFTDARRKSSWAALMGVLVAIFALTLVAVSSKVLFAACLIHHDPTPLPRPWAEESFPGCKSLIVFPEQSAVEAPRSVLAVENSFDKQVAETNKGRFDKEVSDEAASEEKATSASAASPSPAPAPSALHPDQLDTNKDKVSCSRPRAVGCMRLSLSLRG